MSSSATAAMVLVEGRVDGRPISADDQEAGMSVANIATVKADKLTTEALKRVSEIYHGQTNRNLQQEAEQFVDDVDNDSVMMSSEFLRKFSLIKEEVSAVVAKVVKMDLLCKEMFNRLQKTKAQTRNLTEHISRLQSDRSRIRTTQSIVESFLSLLQLKPEEIKALNVTPTDELSQAFFAALARVTEVHKNAKRLSILGSGNAGNSDDILKVIRDWKRRPPWTQKRWSSTFLPLLDADECLRLSSEMPDITPVLVKAVSCLQTRSTLFQYSLEEYCRARRNYTVLAFIDALTKGAPHGSGVPMELLSSDPIRYINDMLAWIHKALMTEKEILMNLLRMCTSEVIEEHLQPALASCLEGVCRPFKIRVEQIVDNCHGTVLLYRIFNLIRVYNETVSSSLRPEATLYLTFVDLKELLSNLFTYSLNCAVSAIVSKFEMPNSDLTPVASQQRLLLLLRDLLESHNVMPVPIADKKQSFSVVLSTVVDPLLSALNLSSTHVPAVDLAVYMLNSIYPLRSVLSLYEYMDEKLEMLQAQIEVHLNVLVEQQTNYILQCTDLVKLYEAIRQGDKSQDKQSLEGRIAQSSIKNSMIWLERVLSLFDEWKDDSFRQFVENPASYSLSVCQLIISPTLKKAVKDETRKSVLSVYEHVYAALVAPDVTSKQSELSSTFVSPMIAAKLLEEKF